MDPSEIRLYDISVSEGLRKRQRNSSMVSFGGLLDFLALWVRLAAPAMPATGVGVAAVIGVAATITAFGVGEAGMDIVGEDSI
jgi:hypothetical protein